MRLDYHWLLYWNGRLRNNDRDIEIYGKAKDWNEKPVSGDKGSEPRVRPPNRWLGSTDGRQRLSNKSLRYADRDDVVPARSNKNMAARSMVPMRAAATISDLKSCIGGRMIGREGWSYFQAQRHPRQS